MEQISERPQETDRSIQGTGQPAQLTRKQLYEAARDAQRAALTRLGDAQRRGAGPRELVRLNHEYEDAKNVRRRAFEDYMNE